MSHLFHRLIQVSQTSVDGDTFAGRAPSINVDAVSLTLDSSTGAEAVAI